MGTSNCAPTRSQSAILSAQLLILLFLILAMIPVRFYEHVPFFHITHFYSRNPTPMDYVVFPCVWILSLGSLIQCM